MENENEHAGKHYAPRFTTIHHKARLDLGLSFLEYCVCDSIDKLSRAPENKGWCKASRAYLARFLGATERGVIKIIGRLIERGLVERKGDTRYDGWLRTTKKWYFAVTVQETREVSPGAAQGERSSGKGKNRVNTVQSKGEPSSVCRVNGVQAINTLYNNKDNNTHIEPTDPESLSRVCADIFKKHGIEPKSTDIVQYGAAIVEKCVSFAAANAKTNPTAYFLKILPEHESIPEIKDQRAGGPLTQVKGSDDWGFDFMDETDAEAEKRKTDEAQALEDMKSENVEEKLEALKQAVQDTGPAG